MERENSSNKSTTRRYRNRLDNSLSVLLAPRSGVTIVEVIVTMSIIGLLVAIALPAVQWARESSRRSECSNHLHQIGIALNQHHEVHGGFPSSESDLFVELLPFMEQRELHSILNGKSQPPVGFSMPELPWLKCPSDPAAQNNGVTNYTYNRGTILLTPTRADNGFSKGTSDLRAADFTDGLSQTVALSERLVLPQATNSSGDQRRFQGTVAQTFSFGQDFEFANECMNRRIPGNMGHSGEFQGPVGYSHLLPPNRPGCYNGPTTVSGAIRYSESLYTASSIHSDGVNVLIADGSVRFVADQIDRDVWIALGTRSNGDHVSQF